MLIDSHTHITSEGWPKFSDEFSRVADAVAYLRDAGTDAAIFTPWQAVFATTEEDLHEGNAAALRLAKEYDGFLYPGATIHPAFPEASLEWLARFRDAGYLWVGELVPYRKPYRYIDTAFLKLCEACTAGKHILQLHVHADIVELAKRFPELPVVVSHIDKGQLAAQAAQPNLWLDISGNAGGLYYGYIELAVKAFGVERVLYGTDFTGYEPRGFQVRLEAAVSNAEAREAIRWRNVTRLVESVGGKSIL